MKILRSQLEPFERQIHHQGSLAELEIDDLGDPSTPVIIDLVGFEDNDALKIKGKLSTSLGLTCDRCLQDITLEIEGNLNIALVSESSDDCTEEDGS